MATITHTGEMVSVGGGGFVATITHTGEVESVGGGGLCGYLYIQVRWGAWGGGGRRQPYSIVYRNSNSTSLFVSRSFDVDGSCLPTQYCNFNM